MSKLYVTRALEASPPHLRSVVNLREMYNFIDTSTAVDLISEVGRVAARLIGDVFMHPHRENLAVDIETLRQVPIAQGDRISELMAGLHTDEYLIRQWKAQEWMNTVMKPAFFKRLDILCLPLVSVTPPAGWSERMRHDPFVIAQGTRVNVRFGLNRKEIQETALGRFFTNRLAAKVLQQGEQCVMDRQVFQTDMYLFTNFCLGVSAEEQPTPHYFVAEWAEQVVESIRDWLLSGDAKIPHVLTKLSPEQALAESVKWHVQLERKKQREAEEKLASMDFGSREFVGSITMDGIRDYQTDKPALYSLRKEVLTIHNLMDSAALQYESVWQHHCVDTYWFRVANCECVILHVDDTQGGRWTVEVSGDSIETPLGSTRLLTTVRQIKGPANQAPPSYVRVGLEFWLKYVNMFIYNDKVNFGEKTLWRYPFRDYAVASGTLLSSGFLGTMMQKNSEARFNSKEHVVEIECTVTERLPFSGRSTSDPTTKYRIIPTGLGDDDSVNGQSQTST